MLKPVISGRGDSTIRWIPNPHSLLLVDNLHGQRILARCRAPGEFHGGLPLEVEVLMCIPFL